MVLSILDLIKDPRIFDEVMHLAATYGAQAGINYALIHLKLPLPNCASSWQTARSTALKALNRNQFTPIANVIQGLNKPDQQRVTRALYELKKHERVERIGIGKAAAYRLI